MEILKEESIRFRGSPRNVEGLAQLTPQQALAISLWLDLTLTETEQQSLTLQTEPLSATLTRLRFALPETVPPGIYNGTLQFEEERRPITVEIEPYASLVISPSRLSLQVSSATQSIVSLILGNTGNVPCEINHVYAFGLFDVEGAERSIGVAIRSSEDEGQGRLDRLLEEVADNHGGLVRVTIDEGSGLIEPGELRDVKATLRFSDRLKPGHTYSGTWPLLNLKFGVRVNVLTPPTSEPKRKGRPKEST